MPNATMTITIKLKRRSLWGLVRYFPRLVVKHYHALRKHNDRIWAMIGAVYLASHLFLVNGKEAQ